MGRMELDLGLEPVRGPIAETYTAVAGVDAAAHDRKAEAGATVLPGAGSVGAVQPAPRPPPPRLQ